MKNIIKNILLITIICIFSLSLCASSKLERIDYENYIKEQFKELYNTEVDVEYTSFEYKRCRLSPEYRYIYFCQVMVSGEAYDTVVTLDENRNIEMYTMYDEQFVDVLYEGVDKNDYWYRRGDHSGRDWCLEYYSAPEVIFYSDYGFREFAQALSELPPENIGTGFNIKARYLNSRMNIPVRSEYTTEDYLNILNKLLPEVKIIPKEESHDVMLMGASSPMCSYSELEDERIAFSFNIYYDGTIKCAEIYSVSGAKIIGEIEMSDYDYSLVRNALEKQFNDYEHEVEVCDGEIWGMKYYSMDGELLEYYIGYIYDSELLEGIVWNIFNKYRIELECR